MSGLSLAEIQFAGGGYSISGTQPLTLTGSSGVGIDNTTGINTIDAPLTLGANLTFTEEAGTLNLGGVIGGSGNLTQGAGGTTGSLVLGGANTYTGTTTVSAGTLSISADDNLGAVPGSASPGSLTLSGGTLATTASFTLNANRGISLGASGGTIDVAGGTTLTYNGIAAGTGSLTKTDTGTLVLGGANTYSGTTTISAGTLQVGASNAIPGSSDLTDNATLDLDGYSDTIGALSGSGTVTSSVAGPVTLTVGATNDSGTFTGVIQDGGGTVALTVTGTGTETLSGANTYTGTTTINAGAISVSADDNLGAVPGTAIPGSLTLNGGTLATTASFTLNANRGINLGASGGTIDVAGGTTLTYNGIAAGTGSLTKIDTGTLILGGTNTYSGTTTISAGTMQVGIANAIPSTSDVTDNATLDLDGNSDTVGALSGTGTVTSSVAGPATLTVGATNDSGTFSGVIQNGTGTVALTENGTGTETLSGADTYTGTTTIGTGTLLVDGSLAAGSAVSVSSGATLGGGTTTTSGTVSGTVSDSGTIAPGPTSGSSGTGILDTGNITFNSGSSFDVDLNGTAAGSGYDHLDVTGSASLGSGASTLNLSIGPDFSATVGTTFVIINTTTGVSGTFSGLSEGSPIVVCGRKFTISYAGNSNNEVVLTYQQSTPTVTFSVNTAAGGTAMSSGNDITVNYVSDGVSEQATIWDNHSFTGGVDTGSTVTNGIKGRCKSFLSNGLRFSYARQFGHHIDI